MAVSYTFTPPTTAPLDPGGERNHKPKVLMAQFGDGYSQRAADGLNNDPRVRQMSWTNLTGAEKTSIYDFFKARNGVQAFYYQEWDEASPKVFICTEWKVIDVAYNTYTVNATFQEVFDL